MAYAETAQQVCDLLCAHRSIRRYTDQAISAQMVEQLLACGQMAASSSHVQAASVIRITDQTKRARLQQLCADQSYVTEAAEFWVFCADLHRAAQCVVRAGEKPDLGFTEQLLIATIDAALFAQNVVVAAESMGLGICYIGALRNHPEEVATLLSLPNQVFATFGLCLGYPAQDPICKPRLPSSVVCMENTYDDTHAAAHIASYDRVMQDYYLQRTGKTPAPDWSSTLVRKFARETRPHIRDFLHKRGLMKS